MSSSIVTIDMRAKSSGTDSPGKQHQQLLLRRQVLHLPAYITVSNRAASVKPSLSWRRINTPSHTSEHTQVAGQAVSLEYFHGYLEAQLQDPARQGQC
ncbi:hypothetical protein AAE478_008887 [Parahypoxylon ruwenzoriense]